jgi:hypothetical protein
LYTYRLLVLSFRRYDVRHRHSLATLADTPDGKPWAIWSKAYPEYP